MAGPVETPNAYAPLASLNGENWKKKEACWYSAPPWNKISILFKLNKIQERKRECVCERVWERKKERERERERERGREGRRERDLVLKFISVLFSSTHLPSPAMIPAAYHLPGKQSDKGDMCVLWVCRPHLFYLFYFIRIGHRSRVYVTFLGVCSPVVRCSQVSAGLQPAKDHVFRLLCYRLRLMTTGKHAKNSVSRKLEIGAYPDVVHAAEYS